MLALCLGACGDDDDIAPTDASTPDAAIPDGSEPSDRDLPMYAPDAGEPLVDDGGAPTTGSCAAGADVVDVGDANVARATVVTTGEEDHATPSSACSTRGLRGPDVVLRYTPPIDGVLAVSTFSATTDFDTVVYVRSACDGTGEELGCNDDLTDFTGMSVTTASVRAGVPVFVVVDGYGEREYGTASVSLQVMPPPTMVSAGETCESAPLLTTTMAGDIMLGVATGTFAGATDDITGHACSGVDHAFALSLSAGYFVRADIEGVTGTTFEILDVCTLAGDTCTDDFYEAGLPAGSYTLVVDHRGPTVPAEPYTLRFVAARFGP